MLDHLLSQLETRAGSAMLTVRRPSVGDWEVTIFRDHPRIDRVLYLSGHGDTLADAAHDLLSDPMAA